MSDDFGTVIHGTHRPEDLIPAFIDALSERLEETSLLPGADHPDKVREHGNAQSELGEIERRCEAGEPYFESEEAQYDLELLFDRLNEYAPAGSYFGANEGDGADFGFWPSEPEEPEEPEDQEDTTDQHCQSCEVLWINGLKCHETGCPDSWRDTSRSCRWCGTSFRPETARQAFCDPSCAESFDG